MPHAPPPSLEKADGEEPAAQLSTFTKVTGVIALSLCIVLFALDGTMVSVAVPRMVSDLGGAELLSWCVGGIGSGDRWEVNSYHYPGLTSFPGLEPLTCLHLAPLDRSGANSGISLDESFCSSSTSSSSCSHLCSVPSHQT